MHIGQWLTSPSRLTKAVTRGGGVLGVKTPPKLFAIFLVSQLCLFVQPNIFYLRLLDIGVYLNYQNTKQKSMHKNSPF